MEIRFTNSKLFQNVFIKETFMVEGEVYMKTETLYDDAGKVRNAINLEYGTSAMIEDDLSVILVDGTLNIK